MLEGRRKVLPGVWGSVAVPATAHGLCRGAHGLQFWASSVQLLAKCLLEAAHPPGTSPFHMEQLLCVPGLCFWGWIVSELFGQS